MKLKIMPAAKEDIYRDIIRVHEKYRIDINNSLIAEGSVCRLSANSRSVYGLARGLDKKPEPVIQMDERLRNILCINKGDVVEIEIKKVGFVGQFRWAWKSSDPAYQVMAKLAVLSVGLGIIGFIIGFLSLFRN